MLFPLMPKRLPCQTSLVNFGNVKRQCLFCLMRQKHCCNYFAFNQSYLVKGKIAPLVLWPHEAKQKYMILRWRIRTGSDRWFSKILQTGLDGIQFHWIRTGLGLKNFTVRSSLQVTCSILQFRNRSESCKELQTRLSNPIRNQCQTKFLTWYCFSVILLLRVRE